MKKLVVFALVLSFTIAAFLGCSASESGFTGEWSFSKISKIELTSNADEYLLNLLKEEYGAEDEDGIVAAALDTFKAEKLFDPCYVHFDKDRTYTYDPSMDREATWVFYKTGENEGFLSFYTEIDPSDVTPDPEVFPPVVYNAETDTLSLTIKYAAFIVTVELAR